MEKQKATANRPENENMTDATTQVRPFWDDERSIVASKLCVWVLLAVSAVCLAAGPWLCRWLVDNKEMRMGEAAFPWLLGLGYCCGLLAVWMLWNLASFLTRLEKNTVFVPENVQALRRISWCCAVAAVPCLAAGLLIYLPFGFLGVAAGFMALLVRVIKNAFAQAVNMKSELDLTV